MTSICFDQLQWKYYITLFASLTYVQLQQSSLIYS